MACPLGWMVASPFDSEGALVGLPKGRLDYSAFVSDIVRKLTGSIPPWRPTTLS